LLNSQKITFTYLLLEQNSYFYSNTFVDLDISTESNICSRLSECIEKYSSERFAMRRKLANTRHSGSLSNRNHSVAKCKRNLNHRDHREKMLNELTDEALIDTSFSWLCKQRKHFPADSDVWDLRFHWHTLKPKIIDDLVSNRFTFRPLQKNEHHGL
jgi:hypothetical protein